MRAVRALLTGLALVAVAPPRVPAAPPRVESFTLPNGLQVSVRPIAGARDVALVVAFRVGGDHDPVGKSGLAHLVEHCYVTAAAGDTAARGFEALLARYPGGHTAQTADRHTVVAAVFPADRLEAEVVDAAARMGRLAVTDADLAREKPRVLDEVANMFDRMPVLAARNRAREIVRPNRAGGRRAGLPAHVEALTREDVAALWERHYKAGNAVLALAGAVDPAAARTLVTTHFGPVPRGTPPPAPPDPPPAPAARTYEAHAALPPGAEPAALSGRACLAFAAPEPGSEDYAPFLLFVARLLEAKIPREGFAFPVTFEPLDEPGALFLSMPVPPERKAEDALAALREHVQRAVAEPWSPADGKRVEQAFGLLLGLTAPGDFALAGNPYAVALGLAARPVLGIDPEALRRRVDALKTAPLADSARRLFDPLASGGAVVRTAR